MVGSRRYFGYIDDAGNERFAQLDESVAETPALGFQQAIPAGVFADYSNQIFPSKSRPIEMRYILCTREAAGGGQEKRKFFVGSTNATAWSSTANSVTVDGNLYSITAKIGEKRYLPPAQDTGLLDGDVDDNVAAGP